MFYCVPCRMPYAVPGGHDTCGRPHPVETSGRVAVVREVLARSLSGGNHDSLPPSMDPITRLAEDVVAALDAS